LHASSAPFLCAHPTAAAEITLTSAEVADLEAAVPESEIVGDPYGAANLKAIHR